MAALGLAAPPEAQGQQPKGPEGQGSGPSPSPWIVIGPRTRLEMAAQLERHLGLVLLALLEMSGAQDGQGFRLVIDGAHLEPVPGG